ncbi:MAG: hypothetical protein O2905_05370, partial [Proteobacteria bacterium]|nr:hypothetical protein [Pseudomonadota bacterium]
TGNAVGEALAWAVAATLSDADARRANGAVRLAAAESPLRDANLLIGLGPVDTLAARVADAEENLDYERGAAAPPTDAEQTAAFLQQYPNANREAREFIAGLRAQLGLDGSAP